MHPYGSLRTSCLALTLMGSRSHNTYSIMKQPQLRTKENSSISCLVRVIALWAFITFFQTRCCVMSNLDVITLWRSIGLFSKPICAISTTRIIYYLCKIIMRVKWVCQYSVVAICLNRNSSVTCCLMMMSCHVFCEVSNNFEMIVAAGITFHAIPRRNHNFIHRWPSFWTHSFLAKRIWVTQTF